MECTWFYILVAICVLGSSRAPASGNVYRGTKNVGVYDEVSSASGFQSRGQQYVGGVQHKIFDQCGQSICKRIIVATDQNVIASLSMKNGEIIWRTLLEKSEDGRVDDLLVVDGNLMIVQAGGKYVRCFSATMGSLIWETNIPAPTATLAHLGVVDADDEKLITVLAGDSLYALDIMGREQWTKQLDNSDAVRQEYLRTEGDRLTAVGTSVGSHVTVVSLQADGTIISQTTVPAAWISRDTKCQFTGENFVCVDSTSGLLHHVSTQNPDQFISTLLQDVGVKCSSPTLLDDVTDTPQGELVVGCVSQEVAVLMVTATEVKLIKSLPGVNAVHVVKYGENRAFVTLGRTKPEECEFRGYDLGSGLELPELRQSVLIPSHHGLPKQMYGLLKRKEATPTVRMLVFSQDESLIFFHHTPAHNNQGKLMWVREEALSKIINVDTVDLPVSPILAKMEEEFGNDKGFSANDVMDMFVRRFTTQFSQLQAFVQQLQTRLQHGRLHHEADTVYEGEDEEDMDEEEDFLYRDAFNLKKIIILATDVGKVYGMYSHTGRLLWRYLLPDILPFDVAGKKELPIFMQRTTAHFPHDPQCMLLGKDRVTGLGRLYQFHPVSGHPMDNMPAAGQLLNYRISQVMMIPQMDEHFLHPVVILDSSNKFHVYPGQSEPIVRGLSDAMFMFTSDTNKAQLQGFAMAEDGNKNLVAKSLWQVNLGADGETITNIVAKRSIEHVHSQGIVLADRSVLYKYLNPNLVVITTEGLDREKKGTLNVYLLDVVSGQLVFHCTHRKVKGPVHVVHSENWIVFNMWNQRHRRSEISVLELYEGKKQSNATVFSSLYPPPIPMVLRQSYIFSAHVTAMQATITEKGITNKHVLLSMSHGGVLDMPKGFLDPRRPEVPTPEHREEGIVPYIPELPRQNEAIINYNRTLANIRGIHTSPAGLESHSMVLCYGLDLFYTRVTPSKMFDVLKEDFDYFFIGSVTMGMILISLVTKKLAARKALKRAWK